MKKEDTFIPNDITNTTVRLAFRNIDCFEFSITSKLTVRERALASNGSEYFLCCYVAWESKDKVPRVKAIKSPTFKDEESLMKATDCLAESITNFIRSNVSFCAKSLSKF